MQQGVRDMQILEILNNFQNWFKTKEKPITVYMCRPKVGYKVYNKFLNQTYYTSAQQQFVISRTSGERWIVTGKDLQGCYKFQDGEKVTQESLTSKLRTDGTIDWQKMTGIQEKSENFWAIQIPLELVNQPMINMELEFGATGLGGVVRDKIIYINRQGQTHGDGDFLVAPDVNGCPDITKLRIINGELFSTLYDMSFYRGQQQLKPRRIQKPQQLSSDDASQMLSDTVQDAQQAIEVQISKLKVLSGQTDNNQKDTVIVIPNQLFIRIPKETSKRAKVNDIQDWFESQECQLDSIKNWVVIQLDNEYVLRYFKQKLINKYGCSFKIKSDAEIIAQNNLKIQEDKLSSILNTYAKELQEFMNDRTQEICEDFQMTLSI